jgi:hypothetical protein
VATSFKVELHVLPASEAGRQAPVRSGYHALARFGEANDPSWGVGVTVSFDAPAQLGPGDVGLVRVTAWLDLPPPAAGAEIHLYTGGRLIATGTVSE